MIVKGEINIQNWCMCKNAQCKRQIASISVRAQSLKWGWNKHWACWKPFIQGDATLLHSMWQKRSLFGCLDNRKEKKKKSLLFFAKSDTTRQKVMLFHKRLRNTETRGSLLSFCRIRYKSQLWRKISIHYINVEVSSLTSVSPAGHQENAAANSLLKASQTQETEGVQGNGSPPFGCNCRNV